MNKQEGNGRFTVRNEDSGEVVATYTTFQEALDHVCRFPADYIDSRVAATRSLAE